MEVPLKRLNSIFKNDERAESNKALVVYHGRCYDGLFAAAVLRAKLQMDGVDVELLPQSYGKETDFDPQGRDLYILDFSFSEELTRKYDQLANRLVIIDHHETAMRRLSSFECSCGEVRFDLEKSAAVMAWEYAFPEVAIPRVLQHIQARDLWRWDDPDSKPFLRHMDSEFGTRDNADRAIEMILKYEQDDAFEEALRNGVWLEADFQKESQSFAEGSFDVQLDGHTVPMVRCPSKYASEVGHILASQSGTFSLTYQVLPDMVKVSLRAESDFPTNQISEKFGGGGHPAASGFSVSHHEFQKMFPSAGLGVGLNTDAGYCAPRPSRSISPAAC